jgi:UDP:flavonoid glycosyltransferase YjiC (YdhE family)
MTSGEDVPPQPPTEETSIVASVEPVQEDTQAMPEAEPSAAAEEPAPAAANGPLNSNGMKVLIVSIGTRGDVVPVGALAVECMCQGAKAVAIATHETFKPLMPQEVEFFDLGISVEESLYESEEGRAIIESGSFTKSSAIKKFANSLLENMIDQLANVVQTFKPESIVLFTAAVNSAGPVIDRFPTLSVSWVHLLPYSVTAEHAPPVGYGDGQIYFSMGAQLKWNLNISTRYEFYKPSVDAKRAAWGLPVAETSPFASTERRLKIMGYSAALCPRPSDWDQENIHIVGSLMQKALEDVTEYAPPKELNLPLGLGRGATENRPVIFTFGSMMATLTQPEQKKLLSACVRAACELGMGAIIFTKGAVSDEFGGRNHALIDDSTRDLILADPKVVMFDGECPHSWLFGRSSAVVCHGGIGTIYSALFSKCPVLVSPVTEDSDHAWWGGCVERQGLGKVIQPAKSHKSGKAIAEAIRGVLADSSEVRAKVAAFSDSMRGTNPARDAADLVIKETQRAAQAAGRNQFELFPRDLVFDASGPAATSVTPKHFKLKHEAAVYR